VARILIVDGEESFARSAASTLHLQGHEVVSCRSLEEAQRACVSSPPQLVLADLRIEGGGAFELLDRLRTARLGCGVVVTTSVGSIESAVEAMRLGAFDYLRKPFSGDDLLVEVQLAKGQGQTLERHAPAIAERDDLRALTGIVGSSRRWRISCASSRRSRAPTARS
jgi:two-component system repressor protein LuxO